MKYTLKEGVVRRKISDYSKQMLIAASVVAAGSSTLVAPTIVLAKGGVKTPAPSTSTCDPITKYDVVDGEFIGGYAIQASFEEQQCVSGKTRTRISGINTSTGRTEFATPTDFDKNQVTFYGVRRSTTYEIKITIHSDRDGSLLGTRSLYITTKTAE